MNERIVCLDIGDVRIGVAVSDPTGTIAAPVEVIRRIGWGPDTARIREICDCFQTDRILAGLPLNMDGSEGFQAAKIRSFCGQLEKAGLKTAPSVIITTHDDDLNIYLTIYCRRLRPDVQIISRASFDRNINKLHRAGANLVMSFSSLVTATISNLLKPEQMLN